MTAKKKSNSSTECAPILVREGCVLDFSTPRSLSRNSSLPEDDADSVFAISTHASCRGDMTADFFVGCGVVRLPLALAPQLLSSGSRSRFLEADAAGAVCSISQMDDGAGDGARETRRAAVEVLVAPAGGAGNEGALGGAAPENRDTPYALSDAACNDST